ncbi:MAG: hypothetical protein L0Z48_10655 [candidate division Zixibacteria bacterium]|nr:hypothetical protein [candidate division Zixibacteria bacterium]
MGSPSIIRWVCIHCKEQVAATLVGPGVNIDVQLPDTDYAKLKIKLDCPRCRKSTEVLVGNRPY